MIPADRLLLLVFCLGPWVVAAVVIGAALALEWRARRLTVTFINEGKQ